MSKKSIANKIGTVYDVYKKSNAKNPIKIGKFYGGAMLKQNSQSLLLWGGYIVISMVVEAVGFYFSTLVGIILFGAVLAGAIVLALRGNLPLLDNFEKKHEKLAGAFRFIGKIDVLSSIVVLPLILRAAALSFGWRWGVVADGYAIYAAYVICFLWSAAVVFGLYSYFRTHK